MSAPNPEKGARYLGLLDQALCNGSWSEVPELARKVEKHAPERRCLSLAARTEAQSAALAAQRLPIASSSSSSSALDTAIVRLKEAIDAEKKFPEDASVAGVTVATALWTQDHPVAALNALPTRVASSDTTSARPGLVGWLEVCDVRSAFIRAAGAEKEGQEDQALSLFLAACGKTPGYRSPELRRWTERLLARACLYTYRNSSAATVPGLSRSLRCFMAWAAFWQRAPPTSTGSGVDSTILDIPRRKVWAAYYDLLSTILRHGLTYSPSPSSTSDLLIVARGIARQDQDVACKNSQRAALKQAEATYESLLLNETQFPKADETNTAIEEWVEQVMTNWDIFCSDQWAEATLGEGGRHALGRGVLDILYRAATKTFHSTSILRALFTVHSALGDFDLAMHAFDSYVELADKAKARAKKTGKHELGSDTDDSAMLTAIDAVRVLCRYGDRQQAEKAVEVAKQIKEWLPADLEGPANVDGLPNKAPEEPQHMAPEVVEATLRSTTISGAYRAMGIAHAHYARLTYDPDARAGQQASALRELRRAQKLNEHCHETTYALALVLAETGDIQAATKTLKRAIAFAQPADDDEESDPSPRRRLVPLWHLLALCLTVNDDYEQAAKICDAAFEQFGDETVLFGSGAHSSLDVSSKNTALASGGLIDHMGGFEKESLLQIKITQLALVELMEGSEAAIESSDALLGLYARLFGSPEKMSLAMRSRPAEAATPAKGNTLRSLAGSMRPRSILTSDKEMRRSSMSSNAQLPSGTGSVVDRERPNGERVGSPVSITITNEDGYSREQRPLPFKLRGTSGDWRQMGSFKARNVDGPTQDAPSSAEDATGLATSGQGHNGQAIAQAISHSDSPTAPNNPEQPLKEMQHNAPHDVWPPPTGHQGQPPSQDVRLPAPHPASPLSLEPRFTSIKERQHRISILVGLWLFIAGLYIRADLPDEASGAIQEASKLTEDFEASTGSEHSQTGKFSAKGWGGGKSVDELFADVLFLVSQRYLVPDAATDDRQKGELASARDQAFEAMSLYEQALAYSADHAEAVVSLSNLLMDIYDEKLAAEAPPPSLPLPSASASHILPAKAAFPAGPESPGRQSTASEPISSRPDPSPAHLNRLAARDRAYMLLSGLTRLGTGWNDPEAWYALARAHEQSKQIPKAKQALWWVVQLEENRPLRPWRQACVGGFTL